MEVKRKDCKDTKFNIDFNMLEVGALFEYKKEPYIKINSSDAYCFTDTSILCFYWGNDCSTVTTFLNKDCKLIYEI